MSSCYKSAPMVMGPVITSTIFLCTGSNVPGATLFLNRFSPLRSEKTSCPSAPRMRETSGTLSGPVAAHVTDACGRKSTFYARAPAGHRTALTKCLETPRPQPPTCCFCLRPPHLAEDNSPGVHRSRNRAQFAWHTKRCSYSLATARGASHSRQGATAKLPGLQATRLGRLREKVLGELVRQRALEVGDVQPHAGHCGGLCLSGPHAS